MSQTTTWAPGARIARSVVCGVVAVALACAAHVAAGGTSPGGYPVLALVAVVAVATAGAMPDLSSRRRIVGLALLGQAFLHIALCALATPMSMTGHVMAGHVMQSPTAGMSANSAAPGLERLPDGWYGMVLHHAVSGLGSLPSALMTLAHIGAAVLVGLWLAGGERLLWSLLVLASAAAGAAGLRLATRAVAEVRPVDRSHVAVLSAMRLWEGACWRPSTRIDVESTDRRGPPLRFRAVSA